MCSGGPLTLVAEGNNIKSSFFQPQFGLGVQAAEKAPCGGRGSQWPPEGTAGQKAAGKVQKDRWQGLLREENSIVGPIFGSLGPFQASVRPEPMTSPLRGAGKPLDTRNLHEARTLLSLCVLDTAFQLGTRKLGLCKGICITGEVSHLGVMINHGF